MPPDRALPATDVSLIETWILNGATDDRAAPAAPPNGAQPDSGGDAVDGGSEPDVPGSPLDPQDQAHP